MSILIIGRAIATLRGKRGVLNILKRAPDEKHDLAWWQRWLAEHWEG